MGASAGIGLGLVAALCWGISDVLVTQAARRIGVGRLMIFFEGIGLIATSLVLVTRPGGPRGTPGAWALMAALGLLNCAGAFLLYRAFQVGTLAIVSPLASGYAVVTALLALLTGERPPLLPLLGSCVLIAGIVVITRLQYTGAVQSLAGLPETLGVVVTFGIFYWGLGLVTPSLGIYWPIFALRATRVVAGLVIARGRSFVHPSDVPWGGLTIAAVLCTTAFVAFNLGITTSSTVIVVTLASLASAVTVVLARLTLHEHLNPGQWLGVGLILVGVLLVSR